jgi:hypothetical protein
MKIEKVLDTTQELFDSLFSKTMLDHYIKVTLLAHNKQKEVIKIRKDDEIDKFRTGDDIVFIINDIAFDMLDENQKVLVIEEALTQITYDSERDVVKIVKPTIVTFPTILNKYGIEEYMRTYESVKAAISQTSGDENTNTGPKRTKK